MKSLFLIGALFLASSPAYGELIYPEIKVLMVPNKKNRDRHLIN